MTSSISKSIAYLLREAVSLAKQEGLAERMSFQEISRSPPSRSPPNSHRNRER